MKTQISSFVDIKVVTWLKDSHGLFDYESKNISLKRLRVDKNSNIYQEDENIVFQSSENPQSLGNLDRKIDYLFSVGLNKDPNEPYSLIPNKYFNFTNTKIVPFLIVRSLKNEQKAQKGYQLDVGDVIRFGRIEYRVLEYRNKDQVHSILSNPENIKDCPFVLAAKDCNTNVDIKKQCKICLMEDHDIPDEILINPCNCKGSSEYVHIKCLQSWISMKMKKKENYEVSCSYWKRLNCELCKVPLPDVISVESEKLELLPIQRPDAPYIILERLYHNDIKDKENGEKMVIQLILNNSESIIKLGRGHDCDIRENDISVSRFHAFMKFQNGRFSIFDNSSKFGTLVLLRKPHVIDKRKVALQIGKTVVAFSLKQIPLLTNQNSQASKPAILSIQKPFSQFHHNRPILSLNNLGPERPELNLKGNFFD